MDLGLTEDQKMMKSAAQEFLGRECSRTFVREMEKHERGFTPELWQQLASLGWLGLTIPEEYGGVGLNFVDLGLLMEEIGRYLMPGPFLETALTSAILFEEGTTSQKEQYLPGIASGNLIATFGVLEPFSTLGPRGIQVVAEPKDDAFILNGTKIFIPYADSADCLVTAARTGQEVGDITVFLVDLRTDGASTNRLKTFGSDFQYEVSLSDVSVTSAGVLGKVNEGWPVAQSAIQNGAALRAAQMSGAMQEVLGMTVDYLSNRFAFGRPIGSFQALQHYAANMAMDVDGSRYSSYQALWSLGTGRPSDLEVAAAKSWTSDAAHRVASNAHQCHGAIGFTEEYDLQLFTRRLKVWESSFGNAAYHRDRVAAITL